MESEYGPASPQEKSPSLDLLGFFTKSKVAISLAITESSPFLYTLNYISGLSEEELLELLASNSSVHQMVYEGLCCIEEKKFPLKPFFEQLFDKSNMKKYPDLKPIFLDYSTKRFKDRSEVTADVHTDPIIFAQDKVKICLAITDIFPFVHGLHDLAILSETESLKLQADRRAVSRVIYECLSLIESKDLKLTVVFEYIFQECYLKLYPALQDILQEPNAEYAELFHNQQPNNLRTFLLQNKDDICQAIEDRFPFLHGLHDIGMLSRIQLLRLQADKRSTKNVLHKTLGLIERRNDLEAFFTYLFWDFYLNRFPSLKIILRRLTEALKTDAVPPLEETRLASEVHTSNITDSREVRPDLQQIRTEVYPRQVMPDAFYKSLAVAWQPEMRPLTAGLREKHKKKIHQCDFDGCPKGFSDRSELKLHRKKHEDQQKLTRRKKSKLKMKSEHVHNSSDSDFTAMYQPPYYYKQT